MKKKNTISSRLNKVIEITFCGNYPSKLLFWRERIASVSSFFIFSVHFSIFTDKIPEKNPKSLMEIDGAEVLHLPSLISSPQIVICCNHSYYSCLSHEGKHSSFSWFLYMSSNTSQVFEKQRRKTMFWSKQVTLMSAPHPL